MTTYNWTIDQLERNTADGGVTTAHWRVTAQDGYYSASSYGTAGFQPDPESPDFIAFEDLTEETVIGWVKDSLNADEIEANLASQIEAQKAPATIAGLPW